ncbi:MAG: hypothetical protein V3U56_03710 [Syntrophobacteria bacterium]|jgi:hypothetical protein
MISSMVSLSITVLIPISSWAKDSFDDESVARVSKIEFIAIADVVEKSSKVSAPAVPGALFSGTGQKGKKGKGLF